MIFWREGSCVRRSEPSQPSGPPTFQPHLLASYSIQMQEIYPRKWTYRVHRKWTRSGGPILTMIAARGEAASVVAAAAAAHRDIEADKKVIDETYRRAVDSPDGRL